MDNVTNREECNEVMNAGDMFTITCKLHKGHCSDHLAVIYWNNKNDKLKQMGIEI